MGMNMCGMGILDVAKKLAAHMSIPFNGSAGGMW